MTERPQKQPASWRDRLGQAHTTAGGLVEWEGFPPLPKLTAGFFVLLALDIAAALIAYRLSYDVRALSTYGIFRTPLTVPFDAAPHALPLIVALQVLTLWGIGGYRPTCVNLSALATAGRVAEGVSRPRERVPDKPLGLDTQLKPLLDRRSLLELTHMGYRPRLVASRSFLVRLMAGSVAQVILLVPLYDVLLGPAALPSVFPIYMLLNPAFVILGRIGYVALDTLRRGGMMLLAQLRQALPHYLPRRLIRRPAEPTPDVQANDLEQITPLLDELESIRRARASLNAKAADAPPEVVARLAAEYEDRATQLRLQLSMALGGLRRQGRQALHRSNELGDEMARLEAQASELQLRHEIGELDAEAYRAREDERLAALEACQKALDEQQALLAGIEHALQRAWTLAPELGPSPRPSGTPLPNSGEGLGPAPSGAEGEGAANPPLSQSWERGGRGERAPSSVVGDPLRAWLQGFDRHLPLLDRAIQYFKDNPGALFIVGFQVLLIICAFLLIAEQEQAAENLANIAYLFLVIGVGINLVEVIREGPEGEREKGKKERREKGKKGSGEWWSRVREGVAGWWGRVGRRVPELGGALLAEGGPWRRWGRRVLIVGGLGLGVVLVGLVIWPGRTSPGSTAGVMEGAGEMDQSVASSLQTTLDIRVIRPDTEPPSQPVIQPTAPAPFVTEAPPPSPSPSATVSPSPTLQATQPPEQRLEVAEGAGSSVTPTAISTHFPVTPTTPPFPSGRVTAGRLNMRAGPSLDAQVVSQLAQGDSVEILGRSPDGEWLRVRTASVDEAWVAAEFIEAEVATPTPAPEETPYPAPSLLSPDPSATLAGPVTLLWFWPLDLAEDERFEVRAWKAGDAVQTIDYTQNTYLVWEPPGAGTYNWQVVVVRIAGDAAVEISPPSPIRQFVWVGR